MAPKSAWAAGSYDGSRPQALLDHWDGKAWTQVDDAVPTDALAANLYGVASYAAHDVWASGYVYEADGSGGGFLEHWDGHTWTPYELSDAESAELTSLDFDSPTDGWAVGWGRRATGGHQPAAYHWDGAHWTFVESPHPGGRNNEGLRAVTAISPTDAWAIGSYTNAQQWPHRSYLAHWDGSVWSVMKKPPLPIDLEGVDAMSSSDVWAVGTHYGGQGQPGQGRGTGYRSLTWHWDGTNWEVVKSPHPGRLDYLMGVAAGTATDVWAVGGNGSPRRPHPFILHWDGDRWTI